MAKPRTKSPRAPSLPLSQALDRAMVLYEKEGVHAIPNEVAAQDLGYKSANNGSALRVIATLKIYGLAHSPAKGQLAVAKEVQDYKFNPSAEDRREALRGWLIKPQIFSELLGKYDGRLPSEKALRHALITQYNFTPKSADGVVTNLLESVAFAEESDRHDEPETSNLSTEEESTEPDFGPENGGESSERRRNKLPERESPDIDRIPIRLRGKRRAWIEVPTPFYEEDKELIKRQIDLIVTDHDMAEYEGEDG